MRAFRSSASLTSRLPSAAASSRGMSRALYASYRPSSAALRPLESKEGRVTNAGPNDPAVKPLRDAVSEKAQHAKDALGRAAHATGADEALHRMGQATGASDMGHKVADAARAAEENVAPEVKKYPVEFSMAAGGAAVGIALMLWWGYLYMKPQSDIQNEMARRGGMNVEEAKKMVEAQKSSTKKMQTA